MVILCFLTFITLNMNAIEKIREAGHHRLAQALDICRVQIEKDDYGSWRYEERAKEIYNDACFVDDSTFAAGGAFYDTHLDLFACDDDVSVADRKFMNDLFDLELMSYNEGMEADEIETEDAQ